MGIGFIHPKIQNKAEKIVIFAYYYLDCIKMEANKRLLSLDTLRGFDMMFIMGFATIIAALCRLFPGGDQSWLCLQMSHVAWDGLRHHDTIFPLFLFIAGISFPFSYAKQLSKGASRGQVYAKIFKRGFVLVLLGFIYSGLFDLKFSTLRFYSVLARIGLAWMFAAMFFIHFSPRTRVVIAAFLLLGYWLLLRFVPAPDAPGSGPFSLEGNLVGYIDRTLWPNHLYQKGLFDPEGLLSLVPAIVTAMLGMFTGEFVRIDETKISGSRKSLYMFLASVVMLGLGLLWSLDFPINKALWSSSFVLVVGAYSLAMFALFYYIIDVRGWTGWTKFFEVIGLNSITIYMAQRIIPFSSINKFFLGGLSHLCPEPWGKLILAIGYFTLCWLFLWFLYKKKVFLKV
jgi:predicted acyltransferase